MEYKVTDDAEKGTELDLGLKSSKKTRQEIRKSLTSHPSWIDNDSDVIKETCCRKFWFDMWDVCCYFLVKLCAGRCIPCLKSCRTGVHMYERYQQAHTGLPVTYDDYSSLINTLLLVAALFLAFVSASTTVISEEQFLRADLLSCKHGWSHRETCVDLDAAGYFQSFNATGLLTTDNSIKQRFLKASQRSSDVPSNVANSQPSIDMSRLTYSSVWDGPQLVNGYELPSVAFMQYSGLSLGMLGVTVFLGLFQYLILTVSGARAMGDSVMVSFWQSGFPLVLFMLVMIITATIFWYQSMFRVMQILMPSYSMHGLEFGIVTHSNMNVNFGVYFSAFCMEIGVGWLLFVGATMMVVNGIVTFRAETLYVLTERPQNIRRFVTKALEHLEDDDCAGGHRDLDRVLNLFVKQGYKVGPKSVTNTEDVNKEYIDTHRGATKEMDHFIAEFKYLDWTNINTWADPNDGLSSRERACLFRYHDELYGNC
jgi:hypothetical protein